MQPPWQDPRVRRGMEKLLKRRQERIAAGDEAIGWKVAYGPRAVQEKLGIGGPLIGFLTRRGAVQSGGRVSLAGWTKPVAEPEVAVYVGRDLNGGASEDEARASIAKLGPAIELIDLERPPEDPEMALAGNISHRYVVLSPADAARAGCRTDGLSARLFRRGAEVARAPDVEASTGSLIGLVRHAADYLAAFGERLRAGDVLICGTIVPPVAIEADEKEFGYTLDPVGEVSVRFVRDQIDIRNN
jgi:2-keto-4-pentenoate hydratase